MNEIRPQSDLIVFPHSISPFMYNREALVQVPSLTHQRHKPSLLNRLPSEIYIPHRIFRMAELEMQDTAGRASGSLSRMAPNAPIRAEAPENFLK